MSDSLVTLPSAARGKVKTALSHVTREAYAASLVSREASAEFAQEMGGVFTYLQTAESQIAGGKTLAGAYAHRAMRDACGGKIDKEGHAKLKELLGTDTTTRYGYIAQLHFDFDFGPDTTPEWTALVKAADSDKAFRGLLNAEGTTAEALLAHIAPKPAVTGGDKGEGTNGTDTGAREPNGTQDKGVTPKSWADKLDALTRILITMEPSSPQEWADHFAILEGESSKLGANPHKAKGLLRVKALKDNAKADADAKADVAKAEASAKADKA